MIESRGRPKNHSQQNTPEGAQWFPWWSLVLLLVFSVGTVWLRLDIVKSSYEVSQMDSLIRNVRKENENITLDIARFKSPNTLKRLAQEKFKLEAPVSGQVIYLKDPNGSDIESAQKFPTNREDLNVTQSHPRSH